MSPDNISNLSELRSASESNFIHDFQRIFGNASESNKIEIKKILDNNSLHNIIRKELTASGNVFSRYERFELPEAIREATESLKDFFTFSFKYLGPLRDSPKSYYSSDSNINIYDVGLKGEYTASMLNLNSDRIVKYIPPSHFKKKNVNIGTVKNKLGVAVSEWLQYLQMASDISSNAHGKLGYEIKN